MFDGVEVRGVGRQIEQCGACRLNPLPDALHVVERYRRNQNMLEIDFLFDDPKAYTKPWTGKKVYQLMRPGYEMMEHVNCEEYLELRNTR